MRSVVDIVWLGAVDVVVDSAGSKLSPDLDRRVEEIWQEEAGRRSGLTNGQILCASRVDKGVVTGHFVDYRVFIARERDPELRRLLAIEPVGVSGVVLIPGGSVVVGKRASHVTQHPGRWELIPSGGLDEEPGSDGRVNALATLLRELEEELGVTPEHVAEVHPIGLLRDSRDDGYDICFELVLSPNVEPPRLSAGEYTESQVMSVERAVELFAPEGASVPVSRVLLELLRSRTKDGA